MAMYIIHCARVGPRIIVGGSTILDPLSGGLGHHSVGHHALPAFVMLMVAHPPLLGLTYVTHQAE